MKSTQRLLQTPHTRESREVRARVRVPPPTTPGLPFWTRATVGVANYGQSFLWLPGLLNRGTNATS